MKATAFLLLSMITDAPATLPENSQEAALLMKAIQDVAIEEEIMDPREAHYLMVNPENFSSDLELLRHRYQDLSTAPPLNDAWMFPPAPMLSIGVALNREYYRHLELRLSYELDNEQGLRRAVRETDEHYRAWDHARDAVADYYYVNVRRNALRYLKTTLGHEHYYRGQLPPPVPLHLFEERD